MKPKFVAADQEIPKVIAFNTGREIAVFHPDTDGIPRVDWAIIVFPFVGVPAFRRGAVHELVKNIVHGSAPPSVFFVLS